MFVGQRFFAFFALVIVLCLPLSAGAAVGRTAGGATVTSTGSSSYSVPIVVPPGVNGMTPSLGLSYNSRSDNGIVGVGWSVAGLSAIVRCPRTFAQDGTAREVRLDFSDRFCLDGTKLRLLSGSYGAGGATYRTEIVNFSRITSAGVAGNGPAEFTIEGKDGLIYAYGQTGDSRIEALGQTTPRAWALNRIRDRAGNHITFTYVEDITNGSFRISSIAYGGNQLQGTPATHSVSFVYETRPLNDIDTRYFAGSLVKEVTRLDRVDVLHGSTILRRYELTYEGALSSTSKSRLASLQECAGSPLDCFPGTTFSYHNGTTGLNFAVDTSIAMVDPWTIDVNGDGRSDVVYSSHVTSGQGVWMVMLANASNGNNAPVSTGVTNTNYLGAIPIDYNADGREDLLVPYSGNTWWVMLGTLSGLAAPVNTGTPVTSTGHGNNARAMDVNGDGLQDLVWADTTLDPALQWNGGDKVSYRLRVWGGSFSSTPVVVVGPTPANTQLSTPAFFFGHRSGRSTTQDFNGDGAADILYRHRSRTWNGASWDVGPVNVTAHCPGAWNIHAAGMETAALTEGLYYGDFNADGKTDLFFPTNSPLTYSVRLSTGATLASGFNVPVFISMSIIAVLDWDADGYDDVLLRTADGTAALYVLRSTGEGFSLLPVSGPSWNGYMHFRVLDANGDGLPDLGYLGTGGTWYYRLHAGVMPDLLQTATDGFGNYSTFNYLPLLRASYTKHTDAVYPSQDYQGSLPVVSNTSSSNGVGGSFSIDYRYEGARINLQGRGFEGFHKLTWRDSRKLIDVDEYYNRAFPYTGTLRAVDTINLARDAYISQLNHTWSVFTYGSGAEEAKLPFVSVSTTSRTELDGANVLSTHRTNSVDSASGTLYDTTLRIFEGGDGHGVHPYSTYIQRTHQPIANFAPGTSAWCIGRPGRIEYTSSHDQYGGGEVTRTVNQTWDTNNCRVTQQVVEPDSAQLRVTTDIGYDSFGNANSETVTGVGMPARTTAANFGATGRFLQSATNALSQTTQFTFNASTGTLASLIDPNGIDMAFAYDGFGRKVREEATDGTYTTWEYSNCTVYPSCQGDEHRMTVLGRQYGANAALVHERWAYLDQLDRVIAAHWTTLSGELVRIDRRYDVFGRLYQASAPTWWNGGTQHWTTFWYDLLDRVTEVQRPISDSNPTLQSSWTHYEGLTTRSVDALGKQSTHVSNVLGQLARSTDHDGYYQSFDYDAFGNAVRITDSASNVLMSNVYNVRGMLTSQTDMDVGTLTYTPNALGEVVLQTDAKNQQTSFGYDLLGRLTTRTEPEGVSTFTFGTSASARNIGRLASMSGPGYSESFTYDTVGRVSQRSITSDATYLINYAYNSIGALDTLTYPTSTSGYRLKLQYDYQNGILQRVRDFNAPATVFWAANDTDPNGAVISETLGNGVQTIRGFDGVTGLLDYIQSGPGGSATLQNASYQWDSAGNLTQRSEAIIAKTQNFVYDNLHRLDSWTTTGATANDLNYDALGNITSSTSLGTYTYDATRKHRVLTAGANTYAYDNNGNVTSRNGQPITWYSYNLPRLISGSSSNSSEFFYAPDRSRWKQVASYGGTAENTIYIGGLIEKATLGSVTSWKHYVAGANGAVAEVIRRSSGTNETVYLLKDHLGSTEVITTAGGGQMSRLAYGALGARRNGGSWSGVPAASAWTTITNTTRRGYTSHEMLDNLSLVHMNGRVYDSEIGRFLSADPLVQAPGFTQSFNRYSYAWNNPLSYTDPSGFASVSCGDARKSGGDGVQMCLPPTRPGPQPDPPPSPPPAPPAFTPSTTSGHFADTVSTVDKALTTLQPVTESLVPGAYYAGQGELAWRDERYVYSGFLYAASIADAAMGSVTGGQSTRLAAAMRSGMTGVRAALRGGGREMPAIALGLSESAMHAPGILDRFAEKVGAVGWWDWYEAGLTRVRLALQDPDPAKFQKVFKSVAGKASAIHFNLSQMKIGGLAGSAGRFELGQLTEAELLMIARDPALLSKTIFYRDGHIVPTPQVLTELGL